MPYKTKEQMREYRLINKDKINESNRKYYHNNKEKVKERMKNYDKKTWNLRKIKHKESCMLRKYKINLEQYNIMIQKQESKCAICDIVMEGKNLCIDHNHRNGKVRGLLCSSCNRMLGVFQDNPTYFRKAADYLENDGI